MGEQMTMDILPDIKNNYIHNDWEKQKRSKQVKQQNDNKVKRTTQVKSQLILIPTITVHPHSIAKYHQVHWDPVKPDKRSNDCQFVNHDKTYKHLLEYNRTANGSVSNTAKKKITRAIDYLLLFANDKKITMVSTGRKFNFKIAFITLTLPSKQIHDDNEIKRKCLNSFLIELQKYENVRNYVWRAEKQKNGNIHFHIIIDKFVHWNTIRNRWNRIINKLGYVDQYRENMKEFYKNGFVVRNELIKAWSEAKQKNAYKKNLETGFANPNSTDIHSIKKIHNIQRYFVKYMTKNDDSEPSQTIHQNDYKAQKGRIWGSSANLQNIRGAQIILDTQMEEELSGIIVNSSCKFYHSDYFSVFYVNFPDLQRAGAAGIFQQFSDYLVKEFDYHYQTDLAM